MLPPGGSLGGQGNAAFAANGIGFCTLNFHLWNNAGRSSEQTVSGFTL